jgi:hypothetical protein
MELVKYNNNSISSVTALGSLSSGDLNLLATNTITSGLSSSSFTSSIDSTYDTYLFKYINLHPASDGVGVSFNLSIDGGSNYNVTKTTTFFEAQHSEADSTNFSYQTGLDIAQGTGYQQICQYIGTDNDQSGSGELFLFSPSNTTFVKHFIARGNAYFANDKTCDNFSAGYANTTSAINAIDFKFTSGNIDSGVIKMYGLSKS